MSEKPTIQNTDQKSVDHRAEAVNYLRNSSEGIGNVVKVVPNFETLDLTEQAEPINNSIWETPTAEFDAPIYTAPEQTDAQRIGESANYMTDRELVKDITAVSSAVTGQRHRYALGA